MNTTKKKTTPTTGQPTTIVLTEEQRMQLRIHLVLAARKIGLEKAIEMLKAADAAEQARKAAAN